MTDNNTPLLLSLTDTQNRTDKGVGLDEMVGVTVEAGNWNLLIHAAVLADEIALDAGTALGAAAAGTTAAGTAAPTVDREALTDARGDEEAEAQGIPEELTATMRELELTGKL